VVGFRFASTRVLGIRIPGHVDFDEVNLRTYVRHRAPEGWRRGVVFIRELVPRRAIATIARLVYNEPYVRVPMTCSAEPLPGSDGIRVRHRFGAGSHLRGHAPMGRQGEETQRYEQDGCLTHR